MNDRLCRRIVHRDEGISPLKTQATNHILVEEDEEDEHGMNEIASKPMRKWWQEDYI